MTSLYKENAQSWDICISVLTFPILICSKKAFIGRIFMIQKASLTNSSLPIQMKWVLKDSGAFKYVKIGPNFDLKEHYIHTTDGILSKWALCWKCPNFFMFPYIA